MNVIEYCTEEVRRQGHDLTSLDGIERVGWMISAWGYALAQCEGKPDFYSTMNIGRMIEPIKNQHCPRRCGVRVGPHICPDWQKIPFLLDDLFSKREILAPLEFYRAFEEIHPFVDGNGRTGKVLLNWLNGTLLNPIFPPADFWGHEIQNP